MNLSWKVLSVAYGASCWRFSREVIHSSMPPRVSLIKSEGGMLQQWIHLLGVTPFVLF